jgi:hypothetical protein
METIDDIINNVSDYFNANNIPFVIGGGVGVKMLCEKYSVPITFNVNNLDIFYLSNTPITTSCIKHYRRQTDPRTTTTYVTEEGFNINMTMIRNNNLSFIDYNNMKIMHPHKLISYYTDDFETTDSMRFKYIMLDTLNKNINMQPVNIITKNNNIEIENNVIPTFNTVPLSRRLFPIQE